MLEGLQLMGSLGLTKMVVESDSSLVIVSIKEPRRDLSKYGFMAEDELHAATYIVHVEFVYASRTCNGVAHRIAQFATAIGNKLVWFEEPPNFI